MIRFLLILVFKDSSINESNQVIYFSVCCSFRLLRFMSFSFFSFGAIRAVHSALTIVTDFSKIIGPIRRSPNKYLLQFYCIFHSLSVFFSFFCPFPSEFRFDAINLINVNTFILVQFQIAFSVAALFRVKHEDKEGFDWDKTTEREAIVVLCRQCDISGAGNAVGSGSERLSVEWRERGRRHVVARMVRG